MLEGPYLDEIRQGTLPSSDPNLEPILTLVTSRRQPILYPALKTCYKPIIDQITSEFYCLTNVFHVSVNFPVPALQDQDRIFERAFSVLAEGIAVHAFPGATVAITRSGQLAALKALGKFTYLAGSPSVTVDTIFDLASVSKVVATTAAAMILYERGQLDLEMPVSAIVPEFLQEDPRRSEITVHMLLAHCSGLPAYEKLFL